MNVRNTTYGSTTVLALPSPPLVKSRYIASEGDIGSPMKLAGSILTLSLEAVRFTNLHQIHFPPFGKIGSLFTLHPAVKQCTLAVHSPSPSHQGSGR